MIKINLLNSVTERQAGSVASFDRRIGSSASRFLLLTLAVTFLLFAVVGWDVISSRMAKADAERQLEEQQQIAKELEAVMAEQKDLEQKISNIDMRIEAIKRLRGSQAGPSAVLEAMRERVGMVPGLYLDSVEHTGDQLTFKGSSPDESQVTQFGRSLEFSNGLFSNLNIETKRNEVQNQQVTVKPGSSETPKLQVVNFTIKCAYTPSKAAGSNNSAPTAASVSNPPANQGPTAIQVAKN